MLFEEENEIELILTYKCNWHCDYCSVDTHNQTALNLNDITNKLKLVTPNYNVTLSGGEIGLLDYNTIMLVINTLQEKNCKISLNTNGVFLLKYPELAKYFSYVIYHCTEDLESDPEFSAVNVFKNSGVIVEYMIVVTDNNIHNLDKYLNKHISTNFHIVAASKPIGGLNVILSNKNKYSIISKQYKNITKESIKRLIIKEKNFDSIKYI